MNRRTFLGGLAALVPAAAAGWWWRRREAPPSGAAGQVPPQPATSPPQLSARSASAAAQLDYVGGLPLRVGDARVVPAACGAALEAARALILRHCTDLGFANGAIHGVRALGRDIPFGASDPFRVLLERYTEEKYLEGRVLLEVPVRQEGHRHAMLKTLIEKQCDLDLPFEHEGRAYRFRDYVESARVLFGTDDAQPLDEQSWTLMALARVVPAHRSHWTNLHGHSVDLGTLIDRTSAALLQDTELVRQLDVDRAEVPRNCPAFGRVCGGLHMHYALAVALSCGYGNARRRSEFQRHMQTLVRRFRYDLKVVDQVERLNGERVGAERASITAFDARLKFLGHAFEIVGLARQFDLYAFDAAESVHVDAARQTLCDVLAHAEAVSWNAIQADRQLYESVVSGICHAYNGLLLDAA